MEGRPLTLPQSVAVARRRFWRMLAAQAVVTILTLVIATIVTLVVDVALLEVGPIELDRRRDQPVRGRRRRLAVRVRAGGLVLGEVGVIEAISRSIRLVRLRPRLAVVLALFGSAPQILIGIGLGRRSTSSSGSPAGSRRCRRSRCALVIPVAAVLSFAFGTLILLAEAVAASPAVHAFASLTHYTHGLEVGRLAPVDVRRAWAPWLTPGLAMLARGRAALAGRGRARARVAGRSRAQSMPSSARWSSSSMPR